MLEDGHVIRTDDDEDPRMMHMMMGGFDQILDSESEAEVPEPPLPRKRRKRPEEG